MRFTSQQKLLSSILKIIPIVLVLILAAPAHALQISGGDPWDNAVGVLQQAFTSTIARGLSLVAIVIGGLGFAHGEPGAKSNMSGILFGVGMAVGAVNFLSWLFGA